MELDAIRLVLHANRDGEFGHLNDERWLCLRAGYGPPAKERGSWHVGSDPNEPVVSCLTVVSPRTASRPRQDTRASPWLTDGRETVRF